MASHGGQVGKVYSEGVGHGRAQKRPHGDLLNSSRLLRRYSLAPGVLVAEEARPEGPLDSRHEGERPGCPRTLGCHLILRPAHAHALGAWLGREGPAHLTRQPPPSPPGSVLLPPPHFTPAATASLFEGGARPVSHCRLILASDPVGCRYIPRHPLHSNTAYNPTPLVHHLALKNRPGKWVQWMEGKNRLEVTEM